MDKEVTEVKIPDMLRGIRKANGVSLKALAEMAGMSKRMVWSYEHGYVDMPLRKMAKLFAALGYEVVITLKVKGYEGKIGI